MNNEPTTTERAECLTRYAASICTFHSNSDQVQAQLHELLPPLPDRRLRVITCQATNDGAHLDLLVDHATTEHGIETVRTSLSVAAGLSEDHVAVVPLVLVNLEAPEITMPTPEEIAAWIARVTGKVAILQEDPDAE